MGKRKRYTGEEKVTILREVVEEGKSVSSVAEAHGVHPNMILSWRKQMFEGALHTFQITRTDISEKAHKREKKTLEEELHKKDSVIAQ
jgi:transposase-like protein